MKSILTFRFLILSFQFSIFSFYLFLSGCGFHLRGATGYDLSFVHIQSESADTIASEVKRRLIDEGVEIVPIASAAQAVVYLRKETADRRVLSVSSMSGKLEEFELNFRVEMEIRKPDNTVLMEKQLISLLRDYSFDEMAVLATWAEEEVLREDMFRDIVAQILRRLQALKLGKIVLTQLEFAGLEPKYSAGEKLVIDLVEKNTRSIPVDIWLSLSSTGKDLLYVTPSPDPTQPWQLSQKPQPLQRNVPATQTHHRLSNFIVPPAMKGGEYTLRAVYTLVGKNLDLDNMISTMRSNIAEGSMVIKKE